MKRFTIPLVTVLAVLVAAQVAFGQAAGPTRAGRPGVSQRYRDMSEAEREKLRADMQKRKQEYDNMSPEEREKFRARMRERFGGRPQIMGREQQLEVVAEMQKQLDKLKAAVESIDPEIRNKMRDATEAERTKLRDKMIAAMRDRMSATKAMEQELAKLRPPARPSVEDRPGADELRAILALAIKEKATETAKGIEKLMARYRGQAPGQIRPGEPRPRPKRPPRPDRPGQADAGGRAKP